MQVDITIDAEAISVSVTAKAKDYSPDIIDDLVKRAVDAAATSWLVRRDAPTSAG